MAGGLAAAGTASPASAAATHNKAMRSLCGEIIELLPVLGASLMTPRRTQSAQPDARLKPRGNVAESGLCHHVAPGPGAVREHLVDGTAIRSVGIDGEHDIRLGAAPETENANARPTSPPIPTTI